MFFVPAAIGENNRVKAVPLIKSSRSLILLKGIQADRRA
jgi:hypothetical protein